MQREKIEADSENGPPIKTIRKLMRASATGLNSAIRIANITPKAIPLQWKSKLLDRF